MYHMSKGRPRRSTRALEGSHPRGPNESERSRRLAGLGYPKYCPNALEKQTSEVVPLPRLSQVRQAMPVFDSNQ